MTQPGGPAAINGFLYQIIHHLGWLADVTLTGKVDGQEIGGNACLVLEPRKGGDARAEAAGIYLVEQYKTRFDGTWSLADIKSVLRDLRKAVPITLPAHARYRFVTNGRAGRLDAFLAFLKEVKKANGTADLDNAEIREFSASLRATHRGLLDHLVTSTRSAAASTVHDEYAVLFHLLSRFEMEFGAAGESRVRAIEKLLRQYAPDLGDERKIRERLVGALLERLSKGEARLDAAGVQ